MSFAQWNMLDTISLLCLIFTLKDPNTHCSAADSTKVGYSETKYRLRISRAHPRDCHFAHVQ